MRNGRLMQAAALLLLTTLAGCATDTTGTASGTLTGSVNATSATAACLAIDKISPNRGKPKELGPITTEEMAAILDRDQPVARMRNLLGDTDGTLSQVDKNNAARRALCEGGDAGRH